MDKTQTIKAATNKARGEEENMTFFETVFLLIWAVCKFVWNWIVRICKKIWNWLKGIDIVGMINLTLAVVIIALCAGLILNIMSYKKCSQVETVVQPTVVEVAAQDNDDIVADIDEDEKNAESDAKEEIVKDTRKVVPRKYDMVLPMKSDSDTGITPQIKVVGVKKPEIINEVSVPADELPEQNLYGDVIVDNYPGTITLVNGVKVDGNLFVQNMRKYTLPCDAKINGNLFIRNVERLRFCGKFTVKGNIYVNRQSSFGPLPAKSRVGGIVIL
jgi:hypothetical protein